MTRFAVISFFLLFQVFAVAAPSDYGRELGDSSSFSIFIGRIGLLILAIIALAVWIGSKRDKIKSAKSSSSLSTPTQPSVSYSGCIGCQGRGFLYGEEIKNIDSIEVQCHSCHGYGKVLSPKALDILKRISTAITDGREIDKKNLSDHLREVFEAKKLLRKLIVEYNTKHKQNLTVQQHEDEWQKIVQKRNEVSIVFRHLIEKVSMKCCKCGGEDKECTHCLGTGKELTNDMRLMYDNLKSLWARSKEHSAILRAYSASEKRYISWSSILYGPLHSELDVELNKCPTCPTCNGRKKILPFEIVCKEFPQQYPRHRFYRKIKCGLCNGTGK